MVSLASPMSGSLEGIHIVPSIAAADQTRLGEVALELEGRGAEALHIDIEDGNFVPNITFGLKTVMHLRRVTRLPFCVHLMVTSPLRYVDELARIGVMRIAFHIESAPYPLEVLNRIRDHGVSCGVAFNPSTPVEPAGYVLEKADYVLIMTAEPNGRGQEFIPHMVEKVRRVSEMLARSPASPSQGARYVMVDGGVGWDEVPVVAGAGAKHAVMGRAIFPGGNVVLRPPSEHAGG